MVRSSVVALCASLAVGSGSASWAGEPARTLRVGVSPSADLPAYATARDGFVHELEHRGYTVTLVGLADPAAAKNAKVDLVLALGARAAHAFATLELHTPVVFAEVSDPVLEGLASEKDTPTFATSGASSALAPEQIIGLVRAVAPGLERVGVVAPDVPSPPGSCVHRLEVELAREGFVVVPIRVRTPEELAPALVRARADIDVVLAVPAPAIWSTTAVKASVLFSLREKKPLFAFSTSFTRAGAVASTEVDHEEVGARAVPVALELLRGTPPKQIAVVAPRTAIHSINLVVARRLGLEPTSTVLRTATVFR